MFGLGNRERLLFLAVIEDQKKKIAALEEALKQEREICRDEIKHERFRAESAINLLLLKTQRAVLTPEGMTQHDEDKLMEKTFNLFGDEGPAVTKEQEQLLKDIQKI